MLALLASLLMVVPALASHPEVSLAGSNFEIDTDANIKVDDAAPSIDWASVNEARQQDKPTGQTDDSFGQGTKEDSAVPTVVDGSIPNNKSDLKFFGVYQEGTTSNGFLNLFWTRVQEPTGTTNMDFEFNQSSTISSNGITPVRTAGDILILYDLSQGGTHPVLSIRKWTGSAWGPATVLADSTEAAGSINTSAIPAGDADGLGALSARTFGEAQIKSSVLFPPDPNVCQAFGSAYLKSRSSDSFTAALKDFIAPVPVNISNCGSVKIIKTDDVGNPLDGAKFELYKDNAPVGGSRGAEDTATGKTCTTVSGTCTITAVLTGEYWVVETVTPLGHDTAADQHATVSADTTVELTFVNPRQRGAILVTKTRKHAADGTGDHPQSGVDFTVNGVTKTTDANGQACFDNLLFGDYAVHEATPAGYHGEADKTVTVDNKASCSDNPYVGETVAFHNTPLTDLSVTVDSQVNGGTSSTVSCTPDGPGGTTDANGDGTFSDTNLEPGVYTCTITIDP